jgi:soluble lytic murein transglycosylase-like protein
VRAHKGTFIAVGEPTDVDAIKRLVGYDRSVFNAQTGSQIGANLDAMQQYVQEAHQRYSNVPIDLINAVIVHESKGMWNAVSPTGALGVMQLTKGNYYPIDSKTGKLDESTFHAFNPFNPEKAILRGTQMLSGYLHQYGTSSDGVNKALATYNQGPGRHKDANGVSNAIRNYGSRWADHIHRDGKMYFEQVNQLLNGQFHKPIPGYFGAKR